MKDKWDWIMLVGGVLAITLAIVAFGVDTHRKRDLSDQQHYRQGQVDALSGVVKYELVEQPDGSKSWEKITDE